MSRDKAVVGLFAVLAAVSAIGFAIMFSYYGRDECQGTFTSGVCPMVPTAAVNGMTYILSDTSILPTVDDELSAYAQIAVTNSEHRFADREVYAIAGINPTAALIARAADNQDQNGPYVVLYGPDKDDAFPALCDYIPVEMRPTDGSCSAPA